MSNPGFYSDIYQQIRAYADLVDRVLIALKNDPNVSNEDREQLAQIFDTFAQQDPEDLSIRIITIMLGGTQTSNQQHWFQLSKQLRSKDAARNLIEDLEQFARLLERQQADALAKMRGWLS